MFQLTGFEVLAAPISRGEPVLDRQNADRDPGLQKAEHMDVTRSWTVVLVRPERADRRQRGCAVTVSRRIPHLRY